LDLGFTGIVISVILSWKTHKWY